MTQKMLQSLSLDLPSLPKRRRDDEQIRTKQTPTMKTDAQSLKNCNRGFASWTVSKKSMVYICEWASYLCHHYMPGLSVGILRQTTVTLWLHSLLDLPACIMSSHLIFHWSKHVAVDSPLETWFQNSLDKRLKCRDMNQSDIGNHNGRKRTFWHVHQATIQISLRIRAVWSESSLSHGRNFASLAISKCAEWR